MFLCTMKSLLNLQIEKHKSRPLYNSPEVMRDNLNESSLTIKHYSIITLKIIIYSRIKSVPCVKAKLLDLMCILKITMTVS